MKTKSIIIVDTTQKDINEISILTKKLKSLFGKTVGKTYEGYSKQAFSKKDQKKRPFLDGFITNPLEEISSDYITNMLIVEINEDPKYITNILTQDSKNPAVIHMDKLQFPVMYVSNSFKKKNEFSYSVRTIKEYLKNSRNLFFYNGTNAKKLSLITIG